MNLHRGSLVFQGPRDLPVEAVRVHTNEDGEEPLDVYAWRGVDLVWLQQGTDLIGIPAEELERFFVAVMGVVMAQVPS